MNSKLLTTALGIAIFAVPAAVPASQNSDVKLIDLAPRVAATATLEVAPLLANPRRSGELTIELPEGHTTFEWINQDPFVL